MDENIVLKLVEHDTEVQIARTIRNECRNFMTRNKNLITCEEQQSWWKNLDKTNNNLYVLYKIECGVVSYPIGYGYVRVENNEVLLTGGLIESERGKGFGGKLFKCLVENSKKFKLPIKLELLKTNTKAFTVYNSLGFRVIGDDGKKIYMEYHYDSVI